MVSQAGVGTPSGGPGRGSAASSLFCVAQEYLYSWRQPGLDRGHTFAVLVFTCSVLGFKPGIFNTVGSAMIRSYCLNLRAI